MDSEDSHAGTIAKGAGFVLMGTVLSTGLGFLIRAFLIRQLPTADYGLFALALTAAGMLTTIGTLGLRQGVARTVSRCDTTSEIRNVTLTAITSTLVVSFLFSGVLVTFAGFIAVNVFREPELTPFLKVVGALVPGMSIQSVIIAVFRGKKRVHERIMVQNLVSPVARLVFIGGSVLLGYGAFGAIVAWTIGIVLSTILGIYYLYRRTTIFNPNIFQPQYRSLLSFSLPLMISSAMWTVVQQADNFLLGYFRTSAEVGIYDGAFLLARLLLIILGAFGFLFMPIFSELESDSKTNQMDDVYTSVTEWAALLVLPLYIAILLVPEAILTTVFKETYRAGAIPLIFVASGFFLHVLSGSSGDALIALGRTRLVMVGNVCAGMMNILLNIVLIPRFGISGAAAASAIAYVFFNLFYLFWLYYETGILPFSISFFKPLSITSIIVTIVWLFTDRIGELGVFSLVSVLVTTYFLHALVVIRTKQVTSGDKELLAKLESQLGFDLQNTIKSLR